MKINDFPCLGRGFRPFFLGGAIYSVIMVFLWGIQNATGFETVGYFESPILWHAHEMVFGYTMAIIAGFLLTAVANWTGQTPTKSLHLLSLFLLWVIGRVTVNLGSGMIPFWIVALIDCLFLPMLMLSIAIPLFRSRNKRNFIFLGLLSIFLGNQIWFYQSGSVLPLYISVLVVVTMISLIGGRIIPAFTVSALRRRGENIVQKSQPVLDILALCSLIIMMLLLGFDIDNKTYIGIISLISGVIHAGRLKAFNTLKSLQDPMLWMLQIGYVWVVIGLLAFGVANLSDILSVSIAIHALTTGAIGSMTLAMMVRVALGHTGRDLTANPAVVVSFILITCAGIVRVFVAAVIPAYYGELMVLSSGLWCAAFLLYIIGFSGMLLSKRPDGLPA